MSMMGGGFGMGSMWWTWLWGVLLLAGIAFLVVLAVRGLVGGIERNPGTSGVNDGSFETRGGRGHRRAREILDERFARGELTTEEYRDRLHALGEDT